MQLYHITLNNLRRRKAKMLFVLLGLAIGIATIVSVYGVVDAMKMEMTRQAAEFGVNIVITPEAGGLTFSYGGITLPEIMYDVEQLTISDVEAIEGLASRNMVRVIAPKLLGLGSLDHEQKVIVVGANLQEEFLLKPWLRLKDKSQLPKMEEEMQKAQAVEDDKKMDFEAIDLARQDLEGFNPSDEQIVLGSAVAKSLGLMEGDLLTLSGKELEVYGILMESGSTEDQQIFMNLAAAQKFLNRPDEITAIEMAVDYLAGSEESLLAEINETLPHAHITSLRQETLRRDEMLMRLVRFGTAISLLVLLVGMLVVGLTMAASVRERTREIGVFRALGFRKSHITKMILLEGVLISIMGGFIGFLGGTLIARYGGPFFANMNITIPWRVDLLVISIGVAVLVGLLSSLYPAYQAARQDPVEALRFI
ncbi:ABC-type transport system, involved in lipoprotein release, permease component [Clostridium aceticum]|uniref:ABC-type transport system, involved in lipoprotein release, permease component n=1 Tax=Clostridium aceticum TaxID=84022 RepID=A0A0G3WAJ5_9CLOT|nr:FtsX-like permease family protein [Clostridium aceticum]AKL95656.1 ABC-type transport system, involved in lipoprotein release, permease component [Clostridium aceticum]